MNKKEQMYFEIVDRESIAKLDEALKPVNAFEARLNELVEKYQADDSYVYSSLDGGHSFGFLWYQSYPSHLNLESEFKISLKGVETGFSIEPRKSNKEFYAEFYKGLQDLEFTSLKDSLFGDSSIRTNFSYMRLIDRYLIKSFQKIILGCHALTASQYEAKKLRTN